MYYESQRSQPDAPKPPGRHHAASIHIYATSTHAPRSDLVLCATPINDDCQPDETFSEYYGQDVYVCKA